MRVVRFMEHQNSKDKEAAERIDCQLIYGTYVELCQRRGSHEFLLRCKTSEGILVSDGWFPRLSLARAAVKDFYTAALAYFSNMKEDF